MRILFLLTKITRSLRAYEKAVAVSFGYVMWVAGVQKGLTCVGNRLFAAAVQQVWTHMLRSRWSDSYSGDQDQDGTSMMINNELV